MIYQVEFPGLGLDFTLNRIAVTVAGLPIYWYGVCIAVGFFLALCFAFSKSRSYGINSDRMIDVIMVSTIFAIVCARAFYVAFAPFEYQSVWDMVNLRDGGVAIYGGVIGAFLMGWLMCRWRKVPMLPMFDLAAMGFLIGQGLGRWGNFFNQEAFGTNTTLPWGMYSEGTQSYLAAVQATLAAQGVVVNPSLPVHPTFLYESLWCLLGFLLLWSYEKRRKFHGEIFLLYIIWYGSERLVVEGLRTDSLEAFMGIRVSQMIAGVSVLVAGAAWLYMRKKYKNQKLTITYPVVDKRLDGPAAICWPVGKAPSEEELAKQIEALVDAQSADGAPAQQLESVSQTKSGEKGDRQNAIARRRARKVASNARAEKARRQRSAMQARPSRRKIRRHQDEK